MKTRQFLCAPVYLALLWANSHKASQLDYDRPTVIKQVILWIAGLCLFMYGLCWWFQMGINRTLSGENEATYKLLVASFGRGGVLIQIIIFFALVGIFTLPPRNKDLDSIRFYERSLLGVACMSVFASIFYFFSFWNSGYPEVYCLGELAFAEPVFPFRSYMLSSTLTGLLFFPIILICLTIVGFGMASKEKAC